MPVSGIEHNRQFCPLDIHPYQTVEWTTYDAKIENPKTGEVVFEQTDVVFPESWSQQSVNIVASKYFFGDLDEENGSPANGKREYSLKQLIDRVVNTIADHGSREGYFAYMSDKKAYKADMKWLLVHQYFAFNSPVWFNVGLGQRYGEKEGDEQNLLYNLNGVTEEVQEVDPYLRPQAAACFIIDIPDDIDGIWDSMKESARLFKFGSGVGSDWSTLRSSKERVSGGGTASGPVPFMRVQDATGATIKSGGKTRRAAIMQILRADHPDIWDFVNVKRDEEKKAHALIEQGYDPSFNGEAYQTADFQDVNMSVRIDDEFFQLLQELTHDERAYDLEAVTTGEVMDTIAPWKLMRAIAQNTHQCGDPGIQYDGAIQNWHTCPEAGRINGSNPCSEFLHMDNTACNLASLNLRKFEKDGGGWDADRLQDAAEIAFMGQDILCDIAGYPSPKIAEMSERFRPLGLGFANLGATLMSHGIPYDSDEGRAIAAGLQSIIHFSAYNCSTKMAQQLEPFDGFEDSEVSFRNVMVQHQDAVYDMMSETHHLSDVLSVTDEARELLHAGYKISQEMRERSTKHGYRNSQATVIAPTGTISFYMGCTTTGIEPSPALVQYKNLAGEDDSQIKIVNDVVTEALDALGYDEEEVLEINNYIQKHDTIEGAGPLKDEHLPVFDCAMPPASGERSIHHHGHIDMMAAVQPFVSGAISKTVNMPSDATVEDIENAYIRGWKKGLKALAIYRDGSKGSQPVSTTDGSEDEAEEDDAEEVSDETPSSTASEEPFISEDFDDEAFNRGQKQATALGFLAGELEDDNISLKKILDYLGNEVTLRKLVKAAVEYSDFQEIAGVLRHMAGEEVAGQNTMNMAATADKFNEFNTAVETVEHFLDEGKVGPLDVIDQLSIGLDKVYNDPSEQRRKLPDQAPSIRRKFQVGGTEGYIHVGLYPDTRKPGEIFITVSKEGSTLAGVMDSFATSLSLALQYGVPLEDLVEKFKNQRFEPSGFTGDDIQSATSIVDYVAQWLEQHFLIATEEEEDKDYDFEWTEREWPEGYDQVDKDNVHNSPHVGSKVVESMKEHIDDEGESSGKTCHNCGSIMQQDGTCFVCPTCGEDTGCGG